MPCGWWRCLQVQGEQEDTCDELQAVPITCSHPHTALTQPHTYEHACRTALHNNTHLSAAPWAQRPAPARVLPAAPPHAAALRLAQHLQHTHGAAAADTDAAAIESVRV